MAKRDNQVSGIPQIQRGSPAVQNVPRIQFAQISEASEGQAQAYFNLADTLQRLNTRVEDRLDLAAQLDGRNKGTAAGVDGVPARADDMTIRGRAYNMAAADSMKMQFELKSREKLVQLEEEAGLDANAFKVKTEAYTKGLEAEISKFDQGLALNIGGDMRLRAQTTLERIKDKGRAVARDRQLERSMRLSMALNDEIAEQAGRIFEVPPDKVQESLTRMVASAGKLVENTNQVGADGMPLFSASQRVAAERSAQALVSQSVGMAWLKRQPDMIQAYKTWQDGAAGIEIADKEGNVATITLKEMLGETGYRQAEDAFFDVLKADLAMQAQVNVAADRKFKADSDEIYTELTRASQVGMLTVPMVDAARGSLEPEKYLALRSLAKSGGASVSEGATVSRLSVADANGEDIRGQLQASFDYGQLSREDFTALYARNTARMTKGVENPIGTGRDFVGGSLGKLASDLGMTQAMAIPKAEAEYEINIQKFIVKNERQPTTTEALDIGKEVVRRYAAINLETAISNMPLPKMMTPAQKLSGKLSVTDIQDTSQKTVNYFLQQHGGNREAMENDEAYQEEMLLLKEYFDLLQQKESNGTGSGTAKQ